MRRALILFTSVLAFLACGGRPLLAEVLIAVDKASQRMLVQVDGQERYAWPVSTGRDGYATPAGTFTPSRLVRDHVSREWDDAPMPHSIFFTGQGHAIHGSDATRSLGSPASHGCVRLSRANAARLFALVRQEGMARTTIVITGEENAASASGSALQGGERRGVINPIDVLNEGGRNLYPVSRAQSGPRSPRQRGLTGESLW